MRGERLDCSKTMQSSIRLTYHLILLVVLGRCKVLGRDHHSPRKSKDDPWRSSGAPQAIARRQG